MAVVYIDEVFIINFIVNLILLSLTRKIACIRSHKTMLFVGALIGGLYSALVFVPQLGFLYTLLASCCFLVLIEITFGIKRIKEYIKTIAVFYLISFGFGGASYGIISLLQVRGGSMPFILLAFSVSIAYLLITLVSWHRRNKLQKEEQMVSIRIVLGGKQVKADCLVDTGNALYEPIFHRPVIVVESKQLSSLFPEGFKADLTSQSLKLLNKLSSLRIFCIPFRSLGQEKGTILGFIPDKVYIIRDDKEIHIPNAIIGAYDGCLSSDDRYNGLLNPVLLKTVEI